MAVGETISFPDPLSGDQNFHRLAARNKSLQYLRPLEENIKDRWFRMVPSTHPIPTSSTAAPSAVVFMSVDEAGSVALEVDFAFTAAAEGSRLSLPTSAALTSGDSKRCTKTMCSCQDYVCSLHSAQACIVAGRNSGSIAMRTSGCGSPEPCHTLTMGTRGLPQTSVSVSGADTAVS